MDGKELSTISRRGSRATTTGTGANHADSPAGGSASAAAAVWSSSTGGGTRTADMEPLHSGQSLSLGPAARSRMAQTCAALRGLPATLRAAALLCAAYQRTGSALVCDAPAALRTSAARPRSTRVCAAPALLFAHGSVLAPGNRSQYSLPAPLPDPRAADPRAALVHCMCDELRCVCPAVSPRVHLACTVCALRDRCVCPSCTMRVRFA